MARDIPGHASRVLAKRGEENDISDDTFRTVCLGTIPPDLMKNHFGEVFRLLGLCRRSTSFAGDQNTNTSEWLENIPNMLSDSREMLKKMQLLLKLTVVGKRIWPTADDVVADVSQNSAQALIIMKNGACCTGADGQECAKAHRLKPLVR